MTSLDTIADEIAGCTQCPLHHSRTQTVPGSGDPAADIMFIGEAPGFHEDQQGIPFIGKAGDFLNYLLGEIDLRRQDVFITNVVKCRPPQNRDPHQNEIDACWDYLDRQIERLDPKVIVTLGRFSMAIWFPDAKITQIHGQPKRFEGRLIVPFLHPAAALRRDSLRQPVIEDFKKLPDWIVAVKEGQLDAFEELDLPDDDNAPQQLSLF